MKFSKFLLASLTALMLAACGQEETAPEIPEAESAEAAKTAETVDSQEPKEQPAEEQDLQAILSGEDMIPIPEAADDLIAQAPGKLNSLNIGTGNAEENKKLFLEAFGDVPALPEEATEEEMDQYFNYLYSTLAFDFQDPQDVLDQLEFELSGAPETDPRYSFKENYNIEIILDASGSMANYAGGKTRMELAKDAIRNFVSKIPEEANVSLRVYGHVGTGSEADKAASCAEIDEVYKRGSYDQAGFEKALGEFEPAGWTPVAGALESAKESFKGLDNKSNTNLIYLVSDGIETCGGNPVAVAKSFAESDISPIINVIGFNVDAEAQKQLKEVAKEANGIFSNVTSGEQLTEEFKQSEKVLQNWKSWKVDANFDVLAASNDSWLAIAKFNNQWNSDVLQQYISTTRALDILIEEEKISYKQRDYLHSHALKIEDLANASGKEIYKELNKAKESGLDNMRKEIDAKYPESAE